MAPKIDSYFAEVTQHVSTPRNKHQFFDAVVDGPFINRVEAARLGLGIVVLLELDKTTNTLHRLALSHTEFAQSITDISVKKLENVHIPLDAQENIIAKAIRSGLPHGTADWYYLFTPALTAEEARLNQAGGAIAYSEAYPLRHHNLTVGALIFSYFEYPEPHHFQERFMNFYTNLVSQCLSDYL
jgi:hypothetical protein